MTMGLAKLQNIKNECEVDNLNNNLKASSYNYFIRYNNDNFFGYNFLYKTILRIPSDAFPYVNQFLHGLSPKSERVEDNSRLPRLPSQWLEALRQVNFVIDKNIDELSLIKFCYFRNLYASESLSLIVLPTLWCNLACPYCFEFKKPISMKAEVENALMDWLKSNFKGKRDIQVAWFGGEPLLAKRVIFSLTKRLKEFCNSTGARYAASLTTNGYFLNKEFQDSLLSLSIKQVQVTLDGDKPDHDALKRKRNGGGSFDRVFQNVVTFCENVSDSDCNLSLRINCGDDNYNGIERLLDRFPPIVRSRASVYFRWIWANKASDYNEFSSSRRGTEPFLGLAKLYATAKALGWRTFNPHDHKVDWGYCEVDYTDHYAISPDGSVFLCTHTFEKSESIGCLLQEREIIQPKTTSTITRWYSANPFDDAECMKCQLLPICLGGCRKTRVEGGRSCMEEKESLDLFIRCLVEERLLPVNKSQEH
jgi:uncharacterized protein